MRLRVCIVDYTLAQCNSTVHWVYVLAGISTTAAETSKEWREVKADYGEAGGDHTFKKYK